MSTISNTKIVVFLLKYGVILNINAWRRWTPAITAIIIFISFIFQVDILGLTCHFRCLLFSFLWHFETIEAFFPSRMAWQQYIWQPSTAICPSWTPWRHTSTGGVPVRRSVACPATCSRWFHLFAHPLTNQLTNGYVGSLVLVVVGQEERTTGQTQLLTNTICWFICFSFFTHSFLYIFAYLNIYLNIYLFADWTDGASRSSALRSDGVCAWDAHPGTRHSQERGTRVDTESFVRDCTGGDSFNPFLSFRYHISI